MTSTLLTLLSQTPSPQLIYLHHPHHPSSSAIPVEQLSQLSACRITRVDGIEHHTPRLLFSGILNGLLPPDEEVGEVATWDGFSERLKAIYTGDSAGASGKWKGKGKERANGHFHPVVNGGAADDERNHPVVIITKAERLRTILGNGWSVVTRLAELTGTASTVVLASSMPWDHVRPIRGDAPEPIHLYLATPTREEILSRLLPGSAHPLYPRFLDLLLSVVLPLVSPPVEELDYLASSLWPIYSSNLPPHAEMTLLGRSYPDPDSPPPPLEITIKLLTDLKHQSSLALAAGIESLLPRSIGGHEFVQTLLPNPGAGSAGGARALPKLPGLDLPLCAKFLLVAAYCASFNPAKSDLRLFGRGTGPDGKRKRGGGTRRAGYGRTRIGKVSQGLLGPKPFPIDRLLAIFASIFAEHAERPEDLQASLAEEDDDAYSSSEDDGDLVDKREKDSWLPSVARQAARAERKRKREREREERWDDEIDALTMSVKLWALIPELEGQGLLRRASPVDRLDNIMLRCEIDYETAKTLAKELKITLDEYIYEAVAQ